ncbi:Aurora kinase [Durusdinium trenchii]|uniref:Aurora kinase n=1 Tax=Durusdinium trenchii TaxID=1381693 RepID=A0ABP0M3Y4_9DINO
MAFTALKRIGQSLWGSRVDTLQQIQQHLACDEAASAWHLAECNAPELQVSVEGCATAAVAAGACGRWAEAAHLLQHAKTRAPSAEELLACQSLLERLEALQQQQETGIGLLCGPLWCPEPPPPLALPASWASWAQALPQEDPVWSVGRHRPLWGSDAERVRPGSEHAGVGRVAIQLLQEQFVRLEVESCYEMFLEVVWRQGLEGKESADSGGGGLGAPRIVEEGEPSGRHCARRVGLCIVERIQEAERGKFIEYTIDKGPWPTSYNRARVSFEALDGGTLVTWRSNFTQLSSRVSILG